MKSRTERHGQTEVGIVTHNGREFAALGASVSGRNVSGYTRDRGFRSHLVLTNWGGRVMLDCRSTIVREFPRDDWGRGIAVVFMLPRGRFIAGYALDGDGMLFRGELLYGNHDLDIAAGEALSLADYWRERDAEDAERFAAELDAEENS